MFTVPATLRAQFEARLQQDSLPNHTRAAFHKWLRYDLDFCHKYHFPPERRESLPHFIRKLQQKRQTQVQQAQAVQAIALYDELCDAKVSGETRQETQEAVSLKPDRSNATPEQTSVPVSPEAPPGKASPLKTIQESGVPPRRALRGKGASWEKEYFRVVELLQSKNYSPQVVNAYKNWIRTFQAFTRSKSPALLSFDERLLTVHDGKGQKDRTVPLPETILPELQAQLDFVTVSPATCCKPMTTPALSRNSSDTVI
ncbi:MAG: hypothetical protein GY801_21575 [bacterium]|nr:hypothetical protein [bacterium]